MIRDPSETTAASVGGDRQLAVQHDWLTVIVTDSYINE